MDEITSALDPELTGEVLEVIKSLAEQHYTMLMITHEINFAKELADRVTFLCDGRIVEQGTPEEVLTRPKNERTRVFLKRYFEGLRK
jgi:ABC-type polar amino acid transport system ATPase subunit